jgi:SPOR domain
VHPIRLLRWFVAAALLVNLGYAAWRWGWFGFIGMAPATQREPGRLLLQQRPNALRVLDAVATAQAVGKAASAAAAGPPPAAATDATTGTAPAAVPAASAATATPLTAAPLTAAPLTAAPLTAAPVTAAPMTAAPLTAASAPPAAAAASAATASAASGPLACLDIGPFDSTAEADSAERSLAAVLPPRAWSRDLRPVGAQYAVFVGPINSRDAAKARRDELIKLKLSFETVELPGGRQGGYSLGLHDNEAQARAALDGFRERGLKAGSVALVREAGPRAWLRLDSLSATQIDAVRTLGPAALGGQSALPCVLGSALSIGVPQR